MWPTLLIIFQHLTSSHTLTNSYQLHIWVPLLALFEVNPLSSAHSPHPLVSHNNISIPLLFIS
uniref:Uncharacterized protein n=1 Tax=Octopus bimaculoides TaxID=37653 RepID=A0A0L8FUA1_OCTBM